MTNYGGLSLTKARTLLAYWGKSWGAAGKRERVPWLPGFSRHDL